MITYDCHECCEEFTEENPIPFGESHWHEYCCKSCHDKYNGPDDQQIENMRLSSFGVSR